MKQDIQNIDYEWLFRPTGDPFVDAGGYALEEFSSYYPDANILELIDKAASIYVDRWEGKIDKFFLNSKITQKFSDEKKKIETHKYFLSLINDVDGVNGYCRITGKKGKVFIAGRHNFVMAGSNAFSNFHHDFQNGMMVSKEVIIRSFFLPLACEQLIKRIALLNSNNYKVSAFFAKMICKRNMEAVKNNVSTSVFESKFSSTSTALFRFIDEVFRNKNILLDEDKQCELQMYLYTNCATSPDMQIITLPFPIWHFYRFVTKGRYLDSWHSFVLHFFYIKDEKRKIEGFYASKGECKLITGKKYKMVKECDFQYWGNKIYDNLINGKSILPYILKYSKNKDLDFNIVKVYAIKIRKMKKETIEKIEQMTDFIINNNDEKGIGKAITKLNSITSSYLLRRYVLKDIVKPYYEAGNDEAIVTVKDFVDYLFPDSDSWKELRDIWLIAIYERLHKLKKKVEIEDNEQE